MRIAPVDVLDLPSQALGNDLQFLIVDIREGRLDNLSERSLYLSTQVSHVSPVKRGVESRHHISDFSRKLLVLKLDPLAHSCFDEVVPGPDCGVSIQP